MGTFAEIWLKIKALMGNAEAMFIISQRLLSCSHDDAAIMRGLDLLCRSAHHGYVPAIRCLADIQGHEEVVPLLQQAFEAGSVECGYDLGVLALEHAIRQGTSFDLSISLLKQAVDSEPLAAYQLGIIYNYGGPRMVADPRTAVFWYLRAVRGGCVSANVELGRLLIYGPQEVKDIGRGVECLRKAAERGCPQAQYELALCYSHATGVDTDMYKAMYWYDKAAKQGHDGALHNMGVVYDNGLGGIECDYKRAFEYFSKAASLGNKDSAYCLGDMYMQGRGVAANPQKAVQWFGHGAELGEPDSMYQLALCYEHGCGVERSMRKCIDYLQRAAALGWTAALTALINLGFGN